MATSIRSSDFDPARAASRAGERAQDRERHLAQYRTADPAVRPAAAPLDAGDLTVKTYLATLGTGEQAALATLAEFSAFVGETPEAMVGSIFDSENYRYVRREEFAQQILDYSATLDGTWEERTAVGNRVREFFRANGHTMPPAVPAWHMWLRMG